MVISLTGFMGCGKSSVGRKLSELLCCPFMDLDEVIKESAGRSIPEIFASDGEAVFRQMELQALKAVVSGGWSKTKSLPRLRRGPLPFTKPRAATVFDSSPTDNFYTEQCQFHTQASTPKHMHECSISGPLHVIARSEATWQSVDMVLALGGGAVMTPECADIVHSDTVCIYLRASVKTLMERLSGQTGNRPLLSQHASENAVPSHCEDTPARHCEESEGRRGNLQPRNRIETLLSQRSDTYEKTAHIIIDTDGKTIDAIASEIISYLSQTTLTI